MLFPTWITWIGRASTGWRLKQFMKKRTKLNPRPLGWPSFSPFELPVPTFSNKPTHTPTGLVTKWIHLIVLVLSLPTLDSKNKIEENNDKNHCSIPKCILYALYTRTKNKKYIVCMHHTTKHITLLQVIPALTNYAGIVSDISSGRVYHFIYSVQYIYI